MELAARRGAGGIHADERRRNSGSRSCRKSRLDQQADIRRVTPGGLGPLRGLGAAAAVVIAARINRVN